MLRKKKEEPSEPVVIKNLSYKELQNLLKEVERVDGGFDDACCDTESINIAFKSDGTITVYADYILNFEKVLEI
jgi:hypothetical protein